MRRNHEQANSDIYNNGSRRRQGDGRRNRSRQLNLESLECRRVLTALLLPQHRTPDDVPSAAEFGKSVSIHEEFAVVGAPLDTFGDVKSGSAFVYARSTNNTENWMPVAKLGPENGASPGDRFGASVAIDSKSGSGVIVVGAAFDDQNGKIDSGSAYVFARDPLSGKWDQVDELVPNDATAGEHFGAAVSVNGDVIVVGAPQNAQGAKGAAYVFEKRSSGEWVQIEKLSSGEDSKVTHFGSSVSSRGKSIIVGSNSMEGAAFVFTDPVATAATTKWQDSVQELRAGDAGHAGDCFGYSVSIDTPADGEPAIAVVGACSDNEDANGSGAAYVFAQKDDGWERSKKLKASDPQRDAKFGRSVSIDGDTIVVGSPIDKVVGSDSGAAYVFGRNKGGDDTWGEEAKLVDRDGSSSDRFGHAVAVFGDRVVVGTPRDHESGSVSFFDTEAAPDFKNGADLSFEIAEVSSNDVVQSYFVTVKNNGPSDAQNVRTLNTLSAAANVTFVIGCAAQINSPVCSLGTIPAQQSRSYVVSAGAGSDFHVAVLSDTPEPDPSDNLGSAKTVLEVTDLSLTMIGASDPVNAGTENLPLVVVVTNEGPGKANGVEVSLTLPTMPGITLTTPKGITRSNNDTYLWDVGQLAHGESALLSLSFTVDASAAEGPVKSIATITGPDRDTDPNSKNDSDSVTTTLQVNEATNAAPVIDLNGVDDEGSDFAAAFAAGDGPAAIADSTASLTDTDSGNLEQLTVRITNLADGADESLTADTVGNITSDYDEATGVLTLSGADMLENYQTVLRSVKYDNTAAMPNTTQRTITFVANDGTGESDIATTTVDVQLASNQPPVLVLDGDDSNGSDFTATFIAGGDAVVAVGTDASLTDADSDNLEQLTVRLTNMPDGADESLTADTSGTSIVADYSVPGELTLSGTDIVANYESVLRSVKYDNTAATPDTSDRLIEFVANDGNDDSVTATTTLQVQVQLPTGAAPVLDLNVDESDDRDRLDVNRNGFVTTIDVLLIINAVQESGFGASSARLDVNGDGFVSPMDVLLVTNYLNRNSSATETAT